MEQTQKLKLNLQHFASNNVKPQVFNPDNVMMHEKKDGTLMNENSQRPSYKRLWKTLKLCN